MCERLPVLKPATDLAKPMTEVTTLPSGLRIASEETYTQGSSLSVFFDAGSRYETGK